MYSLNVLKMAGVTLFVNGCDEIENLLKFCEIPSERIQVKDTEDLLSSKVPSLRLSTGQTVTGQRTVATYLSKMSKITLLGNSPLERAQVDQWLEYIQRELGSHFKHGMSTKGALEDLDKFLSQTVYLVGLQLTLADIMLYYQLHPKMLEMTVYEKEKLINLSRWFNQVQCYPGVQQYLAKVAFLRNTMYL
ncbi:eukaryotic translation elongation factor 1 epsilon-1-like isoform X1 [Acropora palmata]|uniref:eukaryotic translation elongation factor 1 epsilon-1-like isoform X1 n=1 Tax=Acropora palmata TaxID=6131 RepID=UPI003DA0C03A